MKKFDSCFIVLCILTLIGIHSVAVGDWDVEDPAKWIQLPDLTPNGIDICVDDSGELGQRTLGDDFECTETGPITDVHIWGSWLDDQVGQIEMIHVSFYTDKPADPADPESYSQPDQLKWERWVDSSQFVMREYAQLTGEDYEWWWDPRSGTLIRDGDQVIHQINIDLGSDTFIQKGTPDDPIIYWLVIEVKLNPDSQGTFGWKTRDFQDGHYMDDAVWYTPTAIPWHELRYPEGHAYYPDSLDMSFVLASEPDEDLDFGDAPDSAAAMGYPTLLISNGANHVIGGPWLGDQTDNPDAETDGQPTPNADGDDNDGNDDEDGVQIPTLTIGQTATITFEVNSADGTGGTVSGWIDYDGDQVWGSTVAEQIVAASYPNGTYNVTVTPPAGSVIGITFARFRITRDTTATGPAGPASDGEVEDYEVFIEEESDEELKFQQRPLDGLLIDDLRYWGHDELSTAYRQYDVTGAPREYQGCYMADDFADLHHSPVIKIKWWGSYIEMEDVEHVPQFLIAFEKDVPAGTDTEYSHPGEVLYSEIVTLAPAGAMPNPGEFTETFFSPGGPPCNEAVWEYETVLMNPFPQDPNTVYWLKIVALYDVGPAIQGLLDALANLDPPMDLCEFLNLTWQEQMNIYDNITLPRWGWHNRDYSVMDPYASTPPAVNPGEHVQGTIVANPPVDIWHFQDDAVSGHVMIDPFAVWNPDYPESPFVDQPDWMDENYKFWLPYCPGTQGVDGPEGIEAYSKDLAFELWTNFDCFPSTHPDYPEWILVGKPVSWCYLRQCEGDANNAQEGSPFTGYYWVGVYDLNILLSGWKVTGYVDPVMHPWIAADFDHGQEGSPFTGYYRVGVYDLNILLGNWKSDANIQANCP